jgi:hypothetical protein
MKTLEIKNLSQAIVTIEEYHNSWLCLVGKELYIKLKPEGYITAKANVVKLYQHGVVDTYSCLISKEEGLNLIKYGEL